MKANGFPGSLTTSLIFRGSNAAKKFIGWKLVALADVVHSAARAMQYPLFQQGFQLTLSIDDDLPKVTADADALEQAILNLLTNAMKYSGESRQIELRLKDADRQAAIEVADYGFGIPSEEQARIFEKFYRVRSTAAIAGTGLGLTLAMHIVKAHGGRIGSQKWKRRNRKYVFGAYSLHTHGEAVMTKLLVIEDDPAILRGLTDNLEFEGYEVSTATDGESAYQVQSSYKPDLIVLDLMLPRMNGLALCRKLRSEGNQTPILMLTARSDESDRVKGLDLGADDYMTKPFSIPELMARVRAILRRTRASAHLPVTLHFGEVEIDFKRFIARHKGKAVELTRKEFAVLRLLASRSGEAVTRDELLNEVWGYECYPVSRTVDNHVAALRSKLEADPARPQFIRTVHGIGYQFVSEH